MLDAIYSVQRGGARTDSIRMPVLSGNSTEPSGGSIVVPKQATEPGPTADGTMPWFSRFRHDQPVLQALVVPFPMIVFGECHERATETRLAQDHEAIQAFFLSR